MKLFIWACLSIIAVYSLDFSAYTRTSKNHPFFRYSISKSSDAHTCASEVYNISMRNPICDPNFDDISNHIITTADQWVAQTCITGRQPGLNLSNSSPRTILEFNPQMNEKYLQEIDGKASFHLDFYEAFQDYQNILPTNGSLSWNVKLKTEIRDNSRRRPGGPNRPKNPKPDPTTPKIDLMTQTSIVSYIPSDEDITMRSVVEAIQEVPMMLQLRSFKATGIMDSQLVFKFNTDKPHETVPEDAKEDFKEKLKELLKEVGPYMRRRSGRNDQCSIKNMRDRSKRGDMDLKEDICVTPLLAHLFYPASPLEVGEAWAESWGFTENNLKMSGSHIFTLEGVSTRNDSKSSTKEGTAGDTDLPTEVATISGVTEITIEFATDDTFPMEIPPFELLISSEYHVDTNTGVPIDWTVTGTADWVLPLAARLRLNFELTSKLL
jgi:hypothetical protein